MSIELLKDMRKKAISSIMCYFRENWEEQLGIMAATGLPGFFLEGIGPTIYNKAGADILKRLQLYASELDIDCHEEEFQYWPKNEHQSWSEYSLIL